MGLSPPVPGTPNSGPAYRACPGILVARWLRRRELVDPRLVQAKLSRDACVVEPRLAVVAPVFADMANVQGRLDRLAAAYRPFALATSNALVPWAVRGGAAGDLRVLAPLGGS